MFLHVIVVVSETGSNDAAISWACNFEASPMSAAADVGINGTVMRSISKTIRPALGCRLRFSAFAPITHNVAAVC